MKSPKQKPAKEVLLLVNNGLAISDVQYAAHRPRADGNLNCVLTGLPSGVAPAKTPMPKMRPGYLTTYLKDIVCR